MLSDRTHCPVEVSDIAEAYVMNTLGRADAAILEEHLIACSRCAAAVEYADHYVRAMKIAAGRLRPTAPRDLSGPD
jgi:Putative zinc-finger